jgi:hypothetical protein
MMYFSPPNKKNETSLFCNICANNYEFPVYNFVRWFGHVHRMEGSGIPNRVWYMNLDSTRPRGRSRNRWQD